MAVPQDVLLRYAMGIKMNILWICTDQQRYDTVNCYGNPYVKTPNMDRLAKMGVKFNRAYSQSPVCAPSRASFLTGRYPRTCGVRQNGQDIAPSERLVTKVFSEHGYTCGLSGKLHISACNQSVCKVIEPRIGDGYDYFMWSHHPAGFGSKGNWLRNDYTMWLNKEGINYTSEPLAECKYVETGMPEKYHQTTWCIDRAIDYIKDAKEYSLPWLFSVNMFDPHHPFNPPVEYLNRYMEMFDDIPLPNYVEGELKDKPVFQSIDHAGAYGTKGNYPYDSMSEKDHRYLRGAYWAMVDLIDTQLGRILDYLEESGQINDTMVIFHSDHGENLGDHGMYLKGPYFYENNVHVPLIIACPSKIKGGQVSNALVELVDLAQTICDAAGIPHEPGMQGKSLWPALTGQAPLDSHRNSVYSEFYNSNINHRDPFAFATMAFDGRYKIVRVHDKKDEIECEGELYDLCVDPAETNNRYNDPDYLEVKAKMLGILCDRMAETCDPLPVRKACW